MRIFAALASATAASASLRGLAAPPSDFSATFFGARGCNAGAGAFSRVTAPQHLCQATADGSYAVWCADDLANGTVNWCADKACSLGCVAAPFRSGQCLAGDAGAASNSFTCAF
jgi:hypothetical protein